jgi:hypothetical protein
MKIGLRLLPAASTASSAEAPPMPLRSHPPSAPPLRRRRQSLPYSPAVQPITRMKWHALIYTLFMQFSDKIVQTFYPRKNVWNAVAFHGLPSLKCAQGLKDMVPKKKFVLPLSPWILIYFFVIKKLHMVLNDVIFNVIAWI